MALKGVLYERDFEGHGLEAQLRERIAAQKQEIEQQTVSELQQLSKNFQESAQHELSTIKDVMEQQTKVLSWSLTGCGCGLRAWAWP